MKQNTTFFVCFSGEVLIHKNASLSLRGLRCTALECLRRVAMETIQHIAGWEPVLSHRPRILRLMMQIVTTAPAATFVPQMIKSSLEQER